VLTRDSYIACSRVTAASCVLTHAGAEDRLQHPQQRSGSSSRTSDPKAATAASVIRQRQEPQQRSGGSSSRNSDPADPTAAAASKTIRRRQQPHQ
jgi:hypothetical protein